MVAQPICNRQVRGSNPLSGSSIQAQRDRLRRGTARGRPSDGEVGRSEIGSAHIAQLAEHTLGKGEVIGSNPIVGSSSRTRLACEPVANGLPEGSTE